MTEFCVVKLSNSPAITQHREAPVPRRQDVDADYTFAASDFNFVDVDGDSMLQIQVTTLESAGSLQLNGVDVALNDVISKADIDLGLLKFVPVPDANGSSYDSFQFTVHDGTEYSASAYTMTVDVTAVQQRTGKRQYRKRFYSSRCTFCNNGYPRCFKAKGTVGFQF